MGTSDPLSVLDHRPAPLPNRPWVMAQRWHDLLFAHWPVSPDVMRPLVPEELELDLFDGRAWVGVVPFRMSGVRLRFLPAVPGVGAFPELNVRTYARLGERAGVHFFSLDATSRVAVETARAWFRLPYYRARMRLEHEGTDVLYRSHRVDARGPGLRHAELTARYGPVGPPEPARPGTLEHFLTERYWLFTRARSGELVVGPIHHAPWPLQPAEASIESNTMAAAAGIVLPEVEPHLLFARFVNVRVWAPAAADRDPGPESLRK